MPLHDSPGTGLRPLPEQGLSLGAGLASAGRYVYVGRPERACERALLIQSPSHGSLITLVEQRMEAAPLRDDEASATMGRHTSALPTFADGNTTTDAPPPRDNHGKSCGGDSPTRSDVTFLPYQ